MADRQLRTETKNVPTSGGNGRIDVVKFAFTPDYIGIMNDSAAEIYWVPGEVLDLPTTGVMKIAPYGHQSYPINPTNQITVFYNGNASPGYQNLMIMYSDKPIELYGGVYNPNGVGNSVTVTSGNINLAGALPTGSNKIGSVDAAITGAIPAGSNKIGSVDASITGTPNVSVTSMPTTTFGGNSQMTLSTTATQLNAQACKKVLIQGYSANSASAFVGNAAGQYLEIPAGGAIALNVTNLNQLYVIGANATDKLGITWEV